MIETKILEQFTTDLARITVYLIDYLDDTFDYKVFSEVKNIAGEYFPVNIVTSENINEIKDIYCQWVGGAEFAQKLSKKKSKTTSHKCSKVMSLNKDGKVYNILKRKVMGKIYQPKLSTN